MSTDTLIFNATVITINPNDEIIENGYIAIRDGKISEIGKLDKNNPMPQASEYFDGNGGMVLPGLINTHTHLPMTLFRGLSDDLPLSVWLNEHIFPAEAAHITPETVKWATLLGCAEILLSGTTTCCDGYFLEDYVAEAVASLGLRAVLGQGVIDFPAPGVADPARNIDHALEYVKKWKHKNSRIQPSIFCHSPYTCSAETLRNAKAAANSEGVLFQIHASETKEERENSILQHGISPIAYLDRLGILDEKTLLVHAVHSDENDIKLIADRQAAITHNPESNMKLASGIAPLYCFLESDIRVGLGTDGAASNNTMDMFRAMDITAKLHKVRTSDPTTADAHTVLKLVTLDAAKAIGLDKEIGSLEVGKKADMILVDCRVPHLTPIYHPVSHLVYSANSNDVRDVWIDGKIIVKNRNLVTINLDTVFRNIEMIAKSVRDSESRRDGT